MIPMYATNLEHLLAELGVIDLMVQYQVIRFRRFHEREDEFRGLYISRDEVDALVSGHQITPTWAREPQDEELQRLADTIHQKREEVVGRTEATLAGGTPLRLPWLGATFRLSWFDLEALLIALAPEIDGRYERLYAYLHNDVTRRKPTVGLILDMLCPSVDAKVQARASFSGRSRLLRHHLITISNEPHETASLLSRAVKLDDRIVEFLLGSDTPDSRLVSIATRFPRMPEMDNLILPPETEQRLRALQARLSGNSDLLRTPSAPLCLVVGPDGSGRRTSAGALCAALGLELIVVASDRLLSAAPNPTDVMPLIFREAKLIDAAVYLDRFESLLGEDHRVAQVRDSLVESLAEFEGLEFVATEMLWEPAGPLTDRRSIRVEFPLPSYETRLEAWEHVLGSGVDLESVTSRFRFTPGRIYRVGEEAREEAWLTGDHKPSLDNVMKAARAQTTLRLGMAAQKIQPRRTWRDLVLPPDALAQLRELCAAVRHRERVFGIWGFERKLSTGKGLSALFAGPSGTGKTLAAEIIAGDLGLDLYRIDLSAVVSKYIGETEKNLSRIFAEAQKSSVVLFFDEADALFGKRSEVKDAHDRYANIEIAYLLQRMEEYDGIAILATNLRQNLDEGFSRRLYTTVEFPFPDDVYRERIWNSIFPSQLPLAEDVDFAFLARAFPFSGGNIKNVAVTAAFLGAEEGEVRMAHLIRAARRELIKMGRPVLAGDFGPYYALAHADDA